MEYFDTDQITALSVAVEDYYSRFTGEEIDARLAEVMPHVQNSTIHITSAERTAWNNKQDNIADLSTIRSGATAGATAVQPGELSGLVVNIKVNDASNSDYSSNSGKLNDHNGDTFLRLFAQESWAYIRATIGNSALLTKSTGDGWIKWWNSGIGYSNHEIGRLGVNTHINLDKTSSAYVDVAFMVQGNSYHTGSVRIGDGVLTWDNGKLMLTDAKGAVAHFCASGDVVAYGSDGGDAPVRVQYFNELQDALIKKPTGYAGKAWGYNGSSWGFVEAGKTYSAGNGISISGNTIALASDWQTKIANGQTSYDWGNHATAGYAKASDAVTALGTNNDYLTWTKNGSVNNITIPYATKAGTANYAVRLSTTCTLWGRAFDGTNNVTGHMNNVGDINFSPKDDGREAHIYFDNNALWFSLCGKQPLVMYGSARNGTPDMVRVYSLYCQESGNVGIGTDAPEFKLDVRGTARFTEAVTLASVTNPLKILKQNDTDEGGQIILEHATSSSLNKNIDLLNNTMRFFVDGQDPLLTLDWDTKRISIDNRAALWYDREKDCLRTNKTIVSDGDVVGLGGIGSIQQPTIDKLTARSISTGTLSANAIDNIGAYTIHDDQTIIFLDENGDDATEIRNNNGIVELPPIKIGGGTTINSLWLSVEDGITYLIINEKRFRAV